MFSKQTSIKSTIEFIIANIYFPNVYTFYVAVLFAPHEKDAHAMKIIFFVEYDNAMLFRTERFQMTNERPLVEQTGTWGRDEGWATGLQVSLQG